jgi:hypothetical protein
MPSSRLGSASLGRTWVNVQALRLAAFRQRFNLTVALALLLHGAALIGISRIAARVDGAAERALDFTYLELESAAPEGSASTGSAAPRRDAPPSSRVAKLPERARSTIELPAPPSESVAEGTAVATDAPARPADSATADRLLSLEQLGVAGAGRTFPPAPPVDTPEARAQIRARQAEYVLDSLRRDGAARSIELGLGPQGPILRSLESNARASLTPPDAIVIFKADIDALGRLIQVTVLEAPPPRAEWIRVTRRVQADLAKTTLMLPPGARGASLRIRLKSCTSIVSGCIIGRRSSSGDLADLFAPATFRLVQAHVVGATAL